MSNVDETDSGRLLRSCDRCRRLKKRCDGVKPHCTRCSKASAPCEYRQRTRWYTRRDGLEPYSTEGLSRRNISNTQVTANMERINTLQRQLSRLEETYNSLLYNIGDLSVGSSNTSTPVSSPLTVPVTPVSTRGTFNTCHDGKYTEPGLSTVEGTISAHWETPQSMGELTGGGLAQAFSETLTPTSHLRNNPHINPPSFGDIQDQLSMKSLSHSLHDRDTIIYLCLEHFLYFNPLVYQTHLYVLEWLQASLAYPGSKLADPRDSSGSPRYDDFLSVTTPPSDHSLEMLARPTKVDNPTGGVPPQAMSDASYVLTRSSTADSQVTTHDSSLFTPLLCSILANSPSQLKPTCLIYTLLAMSCQMSDHPLARRRDAKGVSILGKAYYDHAVAVLPETLEASRPDVVITHNLLCLLKWCLGYPSLAVMYMGLAFRVSQDIKLHQLDRPVDTATDLSGPEKMELERQRRIWWSLERFGVGPANWCFPLYISRLSSPKQIEFPGTDNSFLNHIISKAGPFLSPELLRDYRGSSLFSCVPMDRSMLQCDYELRVLMQDINQAVHTCLSAKSSTLTVGAPLTQGWHKFIGAWAKFDALNNRLSNWFSNLPSHFGVSEERARYVSHLYPSAFTLIMCLEVQYYTTVATLNLTYLFTLLEATLMWPSSEGVMAVSSTMVQDPALQTPAAEISPQQDLLTPSDAELPSSSVTPSVDAKSFSLDIQPLLKQKELITQRCLDAANASTCSMKKVSTVDLRHFYMGLGVSLFHCSLVYMRTIILHLLGDKLHYYLPLLSQYFVFNSHSPYSDDTAQVSSLSHRNLSWDGSFASSCFLPPNTDELGRVIDPIDIALAKGARNGQHDSNVKQYLESLRYYVEILRTTKLYWAMDSIPLEVISLFLRKFTEWAQFYSTPDITRTRASLTLLSPSSSGFTVDNCILLPSRKAPFHLPHSAYPRTSLASTPNVTFPMVNVGNSESSSSPLYSPTVISSGMSTYLPSPTASATGSYPMARLAGLPTASQSFDKDKLIQKLYSLLTTGHRYDPFYLFFQTCSHQDLTVVYELSQKYPIEF
ncbi:hypothetical protein IWQ61_003712 [Dispira simplex]|nr:hypothetical protein IWQ61_003712 [Dispira simplex]